LRAARFAFIGIPEPAQSALIRPQATLRQFFQPVDQTIRVLISGRSRIASGTGNRLSGGAAAPIPGLTARRAACSEVVEIRRIEPVRQ
jgi:hypothetical protein